MPANYNMCNFYSRRPNPLRTYCVDMSLPLRTLCSELSTICVQTRMGRGSTASTDWDRTHQRQAGPILTHVTSLSCQDNALVLLHILGPGLISTPLQVMPPSEQTAIFQLVECIDAVSKAEGYCKIQRCMFEPAPSCECFESFQYHQLLGVELMTGPCTAQAGIPGSFIQLNADDRVVSRFFWYRQTIIGCIILITHHGPDIPQHDLSAFASHPMWHSLMRFSDLRFLIVGMSDVNAVKVLAETHPELWESLGKRLNYYRFASQPELGREEGWVGHDSVSLEQTGSFVLFVSAA